MPPKTAKAAGSGGLSKDEIMLLSIIKRGGVSGIKWDEISTDINDGRSGNAIRQKYQKMRASWDKASDGGGSGAASDGSGGAAEEDADGDAAKPAAAAKKKRAPAAKKAPAEKKPLSKKRKVEVVEEPEAGDENEDGNDDEEV